MPPPHQLLLMLAMRHMAHVQEPPRPPRLATRSCPRKLTYFYSSASRMTNGTLLPCFSSM